MCSAMLCSATLKSDTQKTKLLSLNNAKLHVNVTGTGESSAQGQIQLALKQSKLLWFYSVYIS